MLACFLILPWAQVDGESITVPDIWNADGIPPAYLLFGWLVILWPAGLVTFGGTLDSRACRALFALTCLLASTAVATIVIADPLGVTAAIDQAVQDQVGGRRQSGSPVAILIVVACAGILLGAGYLVTRGMACRVFSGVVLLLAALVHSIGVQSVLGGVASSFEAGAYAGTFGYLLCAVAAFSGPAYEQPVPSEASLPETSVPETSLPQTSLPEPSLPLTGPAEPAMPDSAAGPTPPAPPKPSAEATANAPHAAREPRDKISHRKQPRHLRYSLG